MSHQYNFWNHGANITVDSPARNLVVKRAKYATEVRYRDNSWEPISPTRNLNWFHLSVPTPTPLFRHIIKRDKAFLRGIVYEGATIKKVYVHHKKSDYNNILYKADTLSLTSKKLDEAFELPPEDCTVPLLMSILVEFEHNGRVIFTGAGASFEEL